MKAEMTAPDKTCYCDFLAALPVSDGAVTIRTMETMQKPMRPERKTLW